MQELGAGVGRQELAGRSWLAGVGGTGCTDGAGCRAGCTKTDISSVAYKTPCIFYREGMILGVVMILGVGEPIQLTTWLNL